MALRLDDKPAAASTVSRKRAIFDNAVEYAVELGHLPGEAVELRKEALSLPERGWGELYLNASAPSAGRAWSESGTRREPRQLKHRGAEEVRVVPSPPALTASLRRHQHGTTADGRLFRGVRSGGLSGSVYGRLWPSRG